MIDLFLCMINTINKKVYKLFFSSFSQSIKHTVNLYSTSCIGKLLLALFNTSLFLLLRGITRAALKAGNQELKIQDKSATDQECFSAWSHIRVKMTVDLFVLLCSFRKRKKKNSFI